MPRATQTKLNSRDWIKAGFRALVANGDAALKAEVLARTLKTTKGSFYWHFKDVPTFKREMLRLWQENATNAIIHLVRLEGGTGAARLFMLAGIVSSLNADNEYGGLKAEPAIRSWAQNDRLVTRSLRLVDAARIKFVSNLFQLQGFNEVTSRQRAEIFYTGFVGMQTLASTQDYDVADGLKRLLFILLED